MVIELFFWLRLIPAIANDIGVEPPSRPSHFTSQFLTHLRDDFQGEHLELVVDVESFPILRLLFDLVDEQLDFVFDCWSHFSHVGRREHGTQHRPNALPTLTCSRMTVTVLSQPSTTPLNRSADSGRARGRRS